MARILFAYPEGARAQPWTDDGLTEGDTEGWASVIRALLALAPAKAERNVFTPKVLTLGPAAKAAWVEYHDGLVARMNAAETPAQLQAPLSKLRVYAARLALLLRLMREATGGADGDDPVGESDVGGAAQLCDYFAAHGQAVFTRLRQDGDGRRADDLVAWMRRNSMSECSTREVQRAEVFWSGPGAVGRVGLSGECCGCDCGVGVPSTAAAGSHPTADAPGGPVNGTAGVASAPAAPQTRRSWPSTSAPGLDVQ
jgi:putative DNA primase/helicase